MTRKLGAFKTSMLQDVEAGRPLELDALVGAVREIGQRVGVATPRSMRCSDSRACSGACAGYTRSKKPFAFNFFSTRAQVL